MTDSTSNATPNPTPNPADKLDGTPASTTPTTPKAPGTEKSSGWIRFGIPAVAAGVALIIGLAIGFGTGFFASHVASGVGHHMSFDKHQQGDRGPGHGWDQRENN